MLLLLVKQESCADPPTKAGDNSKCELLRARYFARLEENRQDLPQDTRFQIS